MKKKNWLMMVVMLVIIMSFGGCGNQVVDNSSDGEAVVDTGSIGDVQGTDIKADVEAESIAEAGDTPDVEAEGNTNAEESHERDDAEIEIAEGTEDTAEAIPEEPEVEMVDFETWAKQEGNDEPCLVVWNETTKTQKIIEPMVPYVIQEGDRFAIPYKDTIIILIGGKTIEWENVSYMELQLPNENKVEVYLANIDGTMGKLHILMNE